MAFSPFLRRPTELLSAISKKEFGWATCGSQQLQPQSKSESDVARATILDHSLLTYLCMSVQWFICDVQEHGCSLRVVRPRISNATTTIAVCRCYPIKPRLITKTLATLYANDLD